MAKLLKISTIPRTRGPSFGVTIQGIVQMVNQANDVPIPPKGIRLVYLLDDHLYYADYHIEVVKATAVVISRSWRTDDPALRTLEHRCESLLKAVQALNPGTLIAWDGLHVQSGEAVAHFAKQLHSLSTMYDHARVFFYPKERLLCGCEVIQTDRFQRIWPRTELLRALMGNALVQDAVKLCDEHRNEPAEKFLKELLSQRFVHEITLGAQLGIRMRHRVGGNCSQKRLREVLQIKEVDWAIELGWMGLIHLLTMPPISPRRNSRDRVEYVANLLRFIEDTQQIFTKKHLDEFRSATIHGAFRHLCEHLVHMECMDIFGDYSSGPAGEQRKPVGKQALRRAFRHTDTSHFEAGLPTEFRRWRPEKLIAPHRLRSKRDPAVLLVERSMVFVFRKVDSVSVEWSTNEGLLTLELSWTYGVQRNGTATA